MERRNGKMPEKPKKKKFKVAGGKARVTVWTVCGLKATPRAAH